MYKKLLSISLLAISLTLISFFGPWLMQVFDAGSMDETAHANGNSNQGIALARPPFLSVAKGEALYQATIDDYFASGVAGIAAYTNVGKDIGIDKLATNEVFQTIEDSAAGEYLIGSVVTSGFKDSKTVSELMQVHVFVQREGWIVAYLTPEQPTAQIIDWSVFNEKKLNKTSLEDAVDQVATAAGATAGDLGYYHFGYPEATNLMLIGDVISKGNPDTDSFTVKIPSGLTVYESSFSHGAVSPDAARDSSCLLNDEGLSELEIRYDWALKQGQIGTSEWKKDQPNTLVLKGNPYYVTNYCGIAFLYGGE